MQAVRCYADLFKKNDGVFSRETSDDESHVQTPLTQDSLPTASSSTRDSLPSPSSYSQDSSPSPSTSDKEDLKVSKQKSNASDSEDDDRQALSIEKPLEALVGTWWATSGERFNVERTMQGAWRCVRRGVKLGQQKVYSLVCEADTGRVIWNNSFMLDTCDVTKDSATWRTLPTAAKRKRCTWTRSKPSEAQVADETEATEQVEVNEQKVDESRSYARSLMLQVRLQLLEAKSSGEDQLGISCQGKQTRHRNSAAEEKSQAAEDSDTTAMTTVMLRNLPNQCTRSMLLKSLRTTEFKEEFDLLYVPVDRISGNNLGYCFVNFVEATACQRFIKMMDGMKAAKYFPGSRSSKVMRVCYAKVQGKEAYDPAMNMLCVGDAEQFAALAEGACSMRKDAAEFIPTGCAPAETAVEAESTEADSGAEAEASDSSKEPSASASSFQGLRKDAPEFVPGQAASLQSVDILLEALTGVSAAEYDYSHAQAAARAQQYSRLVTPSLFVPSRDAPASAEDKEEQREE